MQQPCLICNDTGLRLIERPDGSRAATDCTCRIVRRAARLIEQARIPRNFAGCTLDNYNPDYAGKNLSLSKALVVAKNFVKAYPVETDGQGLLLVGDYGLGKTHLAIGILREIISDKGVHGLFCDYRTLLKQIQDSYGRNDISERQVLAPIFAADVLVIDELGAAKPTDWVWDMVQHILNTRYNDRRTTIITTNYRNEHEMPMNYWDHLPKDKRDAVKAMYRDNLGDRITERMRSRLLEMCVVVEMTGSDYRESKGRAKFGKTRDQRLVPLEDPVSDLDSDANKKLDEWVSDRHLPEEGHMPLPSWARHPEPDNEQIVGPKRMGKHAKIQDVSGRD